MAPRYRKESADTREVKGDTAILGISLICEFGGLEAKRTLFLQSLEKTIIGPDCKGEILLEDKTYILNCTKYEQYPARSFENDEFYIFLEGKIYGQDNSALQGQLNRLARTLFSGKEDAKQTLAQWLLQTDGEFVIFMLHKASGRMIIINDVFSRLPLYYYKSDRGVVLSRDLRLVANLIDNIEFDRMAIAQYFLLCYSLGSRTFLKNIQRVEPASLIRIDLKKASVRKEVVYEFNFDIKQHRNRSVRENAHELAALFIEACRNRAEPDARTVLSLSGGLDSRAVGAAFAEADIAFVATSWLDDRRVSRLDVETAKQVAEALNAQWQLFELERASGKDVLKLLRVSSDLPTLGAAHAVQFLSLVKQQYGPNINFFAGHGGDRLVRDIRPWAKLKNLDELVEYVITRGRGLVLSGLSIDDIAALTQIPKNEIAQELKNHFASYPEKKMCQKYVHLNIYGQAFKRLHAAEGRKRFFFWSTTPFWSVDFFKYVMNCPDNQKSNKRLYARFMSLLHPSAIQIGHAENRALAQTSFSKEQYAWWQWMRRIRRLPNPARFAIRKIKRLTTKPQESIRTFTHSDELIRCLQEQLNNCGTISKYLSRQAVENVIKNRHRYNGEAIGMLFTITSVIEDFVCDKSTIENHLESDLDSFA